MMPFIQPEQLSEIVNFVIENYQPSLPSNLDEAAEKIAWDIAPMYPDISWDNCFEKIKEGIKAGAEWLAGQGVKATASVGYYNQCGLSILTEPSIKKLGFEEGDELELTLRKKQ